LVIRCKISDNEVAVITDEKFSLTNNHADPVTPNTRPRIDILITTVNTERSPTFRTSSNSSDRMYEMIGSVLNNR